LIHSTVGEMNTKIPKLNEGDSNYRNPKGETWAKGLKYNIVKRVHYRGGGRIKGGTDNLHNPGRKFRKNANQRKKKICCCWYYS